MPAYLCASLCGVISALIGRNFFILYCEIFVVIALFQSVNERRNRKQIGLLIHLIQDIERENEIRLQRKH